MQPMSEPFSSHAFFADIGSDGNDDGDGNKIDLQICLGITGDSLFAWNACESPQSGWNPGPHVHSRFLWISVQIPF